MLKKTWTLCKFILLAQKIAEKDTITADEENDEVDAGQNAERRYTTISSNAVIHDYVPIFTGQYLQWFLFHEKKGTNSKFSHLHILHLIYGYLKNS